LRVPAGTRASGNQIREALVAFDWQLFGRQGRASTSGKGRHLLPRTAGLSDRPAPPESGAAPGGSETILVAEDEPEVLGLLVELLRGAGSARRSTIASRVRAGNHALEQFVWFHELRGAPPHTPPGPMAPDPT
jgi:hypothetical protein